VPPSRGWPTAAVVVIGLLCLLVGFLLARLTANGQQEQPRRDTPKTWAPQLPSGSSEKSPAAAGASGAISEPAGSAEPAAASDWKTSASEPWLPLIVGPRADLGDPEVSRRALVRLFLDVMDRPPTREEVRDFVELSHSERWRGVQDLARAAGDISEDSDGGGGDRDHGDAVAATFRRFLGRLARPAERQELLAKTQGDVESLGQLLTSSRLYSSNEHRRRRSALQQARSLYVDLLDLVPTTKDTEDALADIERNPGNLWEIARPLVFSPAARAIRPPPGQDNETWVKEFYVRVFLRFPRPEELQAAVDAVEKSPLGWQHTALALVSQEEYKLY
jgi:hypothetical protein